MMTSTDVIKPMIRAVPNNVCHIRQMMIVESCPMMLAGIRRVFAQPCFRVGYRMETSVVSDVPQMMIQQRANLVIMELSGEGESILDGLRVISQFLATWPLTPLIVCTTLVDARVLQQLMIMGVNGIYLKQDPLLVLTRCVLQVVAGKRSYGLRVRALLKEYMTRASLLTHREMDVLECLFTGKTVTTTARVLHRDIRTVSTHKRNAMTKLGFHSDCELYTWGGGLAAVSKDYKGVS